MFCAASFHGFAARQKSSDAYRYALTNKGLTVRNSFTKEIVVSAMEFINFPV
jgi:hypothetical protein